MKSFLTSQNFILSIFSCLFFVQISAQNLSQIDVLTTEDGLLFRDVSDVVQDSKGLLWIGTAQGLQRYDGRNFKTFTADKQQSHFIEEDFIKANMVYDSLRNSIWYLANDALFELEITSDSVKSYDSSNNLKGKVLDVLKAPDGAIWVVTDDYWKVERGNAKLYIQKLVKNSFEIVVAQKRYERGFNQVTFDGEDSMWWTTTSGSYQFTSDGTLLEKRLFDSYTWNNDVFHYVPQFFDSQKRHFYFPSSEGGIHEYVASNHSSKRIFDREDIIKRAIEDHDQTIWFAGENTLYRMDAEGNFSNYTELLNRTFDYTTINNLSIDKNGVLWVATNNGLFKIKTQKQLFTNVFKSNEIGWGNSMRGIFKDAEGRLFSLSETKHQLFFKSKNGTIDSLPLTTTSGAQLTLMYDTSFLIPDASKTHAYAVGKGIYDIDLKTGVTEIYDQFSKNNKVYGPNALLKLKDGRLLFGYTLEHLTVFNPETKESHLIFNNISESSNIADLQYFEESKDEHCVWIGTKNDGVLKIDLNGNILQQFNTKSSPQLSKHHVLCILEDKDGSLWVGSYGGGLSHISSDGKKIKTYTNENGLSDNNVVAILPDANNSLWIATYNGLSLMNKNTGDFQNFYSEDGLSHNEFNYSSFFKDSNGLYYFGGMNGVNILDPSSLQELSNPPDIKLISVSGYNSNTKTTFTEDFAQKEFTEFTVSPYDQYFEIQWTMPSYFQISKNTFSTKLEGFEDRWFYQGNSHSIRYNKLPAGNYILKVKGTDARGNQTVSELEVPITVKQIFYKKWWFIALIIVVLCFFIYAAFRYRLQQALAMERLRTTISSDLHDDVGSLLSGLAMQTELMEMNANEKDKKRLRKIATISRSAVSQMRDLVWSIDSRRETIADLIERMQELAEELLLPKGITFKIDDSNIKNPAKKLPAQTKQHIFLIYKEAIHNITKHSDATNVQIEITNRLGACELHIKDNGTKKVSYNTTGMGLSNMTMRAEKLKAQLQFNNNNGFQILLELPFNI